MDGYKQLAEAIVERAVLDYRIAMMYRDNSEKKRIENFIHSDWFDTLAEIDGSELLKMLRSREVTV